MVSRDLKFNAYVIEGAEFDSYMVKWNQRVKQFYAMATGN